VASLGDLPSENRGWSDSNAVPSVKNGSWIGHETDRRNAAPPVALGNGGPGGKGRKKDIDYPRPKPREKE